MTDPHAVNLTSPPAEWTGTYGCNACLRMVTDWEPCCPSCGGWLRASVSRFVCPVFLLGSPGTWFAIGEWETKWAVRGFTT